jgi:inner membrane protein
MNLPLFFKTVVIGAISLALLILLQLIYAQVRDRQGRQAEVERNIAESAAGPQTVVGPVLVLKYREKFPVSVVDGKRTSIVTQERERAVLIAPENLSIEADASVAEKRRGIFPARIYTAAHKLVADFEVPADWGRSPDTTAIVVEHVFLSVGLGDARGVRGLPKVVWDGKALAPQPGSAMKMMAEGFHVPLPIAAGEGARARVTLDFALMGVSRLAYVPAGKNTEISLKSGWAHPSFFGRALPETKGTGEAHFPATWKVSHLGNSAIPQMQRLLGADAANQNTHWNPESSAFGVAFIDPVNIYLQSERAVKYGILFIGLTFAAFFLFEMMKRLPIHPIQYTLVGLALALFFLLLLSLSEQIGFVGAYWVAALASTGLIGFYLAFVLQSAKRGASFAGALALLYGALYGLLQREDNALLLGSCLLFTIVAVVMVATRKVDWYALTRKDVKA